MEQHAPAGRLRWAVDVGERWAPAPPELALLLSLLPAEESEAVGRFRQEADRKRALVSRLLQRAAAAAVLGVAHGAVLIRRTKGRKPYAANLEGRGAAPNFNFNVSHEVRRPGLARRGQLFLRRHGRHGLTGAPGPSATPLALRRPLDPPFCSTAPLFCRGTL